MKKLIGSLIVTTLLSAAYLAGCSGNKPPSSPADSTATPTKTFSPTITTTASKTTTKTPTNSPTNTPTNSPTKTPTSSPTATPTVTPAGTVGPANVDLGHAAPYVVLAYDSVTNVPTSTLCGGLGEYPGASVTGAPVVTCGGPTDLANSASLQAQTDLNTAYGDAAGRANTPLASPALGTLTLVPGVYSAASFDIASGTDLTLDGTGYANGGVFIFQTAGSLTTRLPPMSYCPEAL